jgi:hypothetical protein
LQIAVISRELRPQLDRCPSLANRGVPLVADVNGTLMARRLRPIETRRASDFSSQFETVSVVDLVKAPITH